MALPRATVNQGKPLDAQTRNIESDRQEPEFDSAAVRLELERLRFALEAAGQGLWEYDASADNWNFSPAWRSMRGIPENETIAAQGLDWLDTIHPDDQALVSDLTSRQYAGELHEVRFDYRERHRDGHWIWIHARGRSVFDASGKTLVRIIGTDTDITALKRHELELTTLTRRLGLALTASRLGVWETDCITGVAKWDARTSEIFGLSSVERIVSKGEWETFVHPDDLAQTQKINATGLAELGGFDCTYRIVLRDGTIRHVRSNALLTSGAEGRQVIVGVNWDVTDDIRQTEALRGSKHAAELHSRALEEARQNLEHASLHDALTGLPNRRCLDQRLAALSHSGSPDGVCVLHLDLDYFKQINDTKGHAAGDAVLVHMARLLKARLRNNDLVARIGGDEFVAVLAPPPSPLELKAIVEGIISDARRPVIWEGQECRSGVSIGVAEAPGACDARQLLINADIALYRAKRTGRNCMAHFTDAMQAEIFAKKQCADDIMAGLERGEFLTYYQPQFDAKTLEVVGLEALVRWRHPERGIIPPGQFLSIADEFNAMGIIDSIILDQAVEHLAEWDAAGVHIPRISLNVSARRLGDDVLIEHLASLPVEPERISFELLESIFLDEQNSLHARNIDALKRMGFRIDIDDFGTGHASIVSLLRIAPSLLKIDRQLVTPITESDNHRKLLRSIIEIGKSQNIAICAEGVETVAHAAILRDLGCDSLQGYYLAKPMPASEISSFVRNRAWIARISADLQIEPQDGSVLRQFLRERGLSVAQPLRRTH